VENQPAFLPVHVICEVSVLFFFLNAMPGHYKAYDDAATSFTKRAAKETWLSVKVVVERLKLNVSCDWLSDDGMLI
jgi:hypothetical protein